jgi:hypothetical protein
MAGPSSRIAAVSAFFRRADIAPAEPGDHAVKRRVAPRAPEPVERAVALGPCGMIGRAGPPRKRRPCRSPSRAACASRRSKKACPAPCPRYSKAERIQRSRRRPSCRYPCPRRPPRNHPHDRSAACPSPRRPSVPVIGRHDDAVALGIARKVFPLIRRVTVIEVGPVAKHRHAQPRQVVTTVAIPSPTNSRRRQAHRRPAASSRRGCSRSPPARSGRPVPRKSHRGQHIGLPPRLRQALVGRQIGAVHRELRRRARAVGLAITTISSDAPGSSGSCARRTPAKPACRSAPRLRSRGGPRPRDRQSSMPPHRPR